MRNVIVGPTFTSSLSFDAYCLSARSIHSVGVRRAIVFALISLSLPMKLVVVTSPMHWLGVVKPFPVVLVCFAPAELDGSHLRSALVMYVESRRSRSFLLRPTGHLVGTYSLHK